MPHLSAVVCLTSGHDMRHVVTFFSKDGDILLLHGAGIDYSLSCAGMCVKEPQWEEDVPRLRTTTNVQRL